MESKRRLEGLKGVLSELSSVLVHEEANDSELQTKSSGQQGNLTEVNTYNFSQDVFNKLSESNRTKQRKLRATEDISIVAEKEDITVYKTALSEDENERDGIPLFVQDSSIFSDIVDEEDDNANATPLYDRKQKLTSVEENHNATNYKFPSHELRHLMAAFLCQSSHSKKFTLPSKSAEELKIIISDFIDSLARSISNMIANKETNSLDRPTILKLFSKFGTVNGKTTNQELFEICKRYLNLEDLNELEISLFS
ncbi:Cnn1 [Kluyveromyces lactis]|nr:Cnn1 [Kluyveromyces lactis]